MKLWTCQRQTAGARCGHRNPARKRNCEACGKPKPPRRRPAHLAALTLTYEDYIAINGGEFCAICKRGPNGVRRLDRDHDHVTGEPRGLLCARCNRFLHRWMTPEWLRAAADYTDPLKKLT